MVDEINLDQESARFRDLISRARRHNLVCFRDDVPALTLRSSEIPSDKQFSAVAEIIRLGASRGLHLTITGGGYGCFQMTFGELNNRDCAMETLAKDVEFQRLAEALDMDLITCEGQQQHTVMERFLDVTFLIATNRGANAKPSDALHAFSDTPENQEMHYGLAELQIASSAFCHKKNVVSRWLHRLGVSLINRPDVRITSTKLTNLTPDEFDALLRSNGKKQSLMHIHGFATDFEDSIIASATLFQNLGLGGTAIAPILYSWPSQGRTTRYDSDSRIAIVSRPMLRALLERVVAAGSEASIVAHSHGNNLLFGALTHVGAIGLANKVLDKGFFCAPDVDAEAFVQDAEYLAKVFKDMSAYVSSNDLALKLSSLKFGAARAGARAAPVQNLNVIDASHASSGLVGHSYYSQAKAVLKDMRLALLGIPASKRFVSGKMKGVYELEV